MVLKNKFVAIWNSPTLMTWGSVGTRLLSLAIVLPLVLKKFTAAEIALWLLFATIIGLQMLADMGFGPTFTRIIAYAMGGSDSSSLKDVDVKRSSPDNIRPNWQAIGHIVVTMRSIYTRITLLSFLILAIFGSWSLLKPISHVADTGSAWLAWGTVLLTTTIALKGNIFSSYLQGINQIALLRRWEIFASLGAIFSSFAVLLLGGRLLSLVVANQTWTILNIFRNRWLCRAVESGRYRQYSGSMIHPEVFNAAWQSAWRSGLGIFMGYGFVQASGILYAQMSSAANVASYLLALRLIQAISQFSQAPFYSKLPLLARLYAQGDYRQQIQVAQVGMKRSYWTYILGFISVGLFADPLLHMLHSNASFVSPSLWMILGLAIFAERYGAMHLQLYSTTNHIVWHVANGVTGIIFLIASLVLVGLIGVYAFPISMFISNIGFYAWYSAGFSYRAYDLHFWSFERSTMILPLCIASVYAIWTIL
jgi:O-antigen/teichoic acid export membrane protein